MKKLVTLLSFFVLYHAMMVLFQSCYGCGDSGPIRLNIASIEGIALEVAGVDTNNGFLTTQLHQNDTVLWNMLGINVSAELETAMNDLPYHAMGSSAFACDPAINYEQLQSINIVSNTFYNTTHTANSSLNDITLVHPGGRSEGITISEYLSYAEIDQGGVFFTFSEGPTGSRLHTFTITYTTKSGETFETMVEDIFVKE